ncbi:UDP-glucose dehydrogenase family protein [Acuticoccus mangrovi]|uniref:UDP-glucose 6-dehydrogenase n=1 Tax=Acuticoccus mangrovi TaxID=2796142 RepID=A0A934IFL2_9HYPH|nr:UDP-glucose/GDP-mannose dehydrogenase family protein [Acuticoccus mangrovi]MBJ3775593.1 UDP-glucose/GDP-mannose dehydrogenase family protein [Acuticoccus mangrovi]
MKVCMIGGGYVGLVSAACFSDFGWSVTCVEKDTEKLAMLLDGQIPIFEPGLDDLVARNRAAGRIVFTGEMGPAVSEADLVFLAVGTPMRRGSGHADLTYVYAAVAELAPHLTGYTVITTKSTVPVGTSREIERRLRMLRPDGDFSVCSNPEFLREGSAIGDFTHPDRVIVGVGEDDARARDVMSRVYKPLALRNAPVIFTTRESAELAKYAANAFLAMKISFINEMADLCEAVGADVQQVATAIGSDRRIGDKFLHAGPGYGGSCFPKDVSALVRTAREARRPLSLVEQVQTVNEERKQAMVSKIVEAAGGEVRDRVIAVLGVTFKPNTDDMREAPSLTIVPRLMDKGASVRLHDPQGRRQAEPLFEGARWFDSAMEMIDGADILVLLTEWNEYRALDLKAVKGLMRGDRLVDLRNVFQPDDAMRAGFVYEGVGRGDAAA